MLMSSSKTDCLSDIKSPSFAFLPLKKTNLYLSNTKKKKILISPSNHGILNPIYLQKKKKVVKNHHRDMRTRRGLCYLGEEKEERKRQADLAGNEAVLGRKRLKSAEKRVFDLFEILPDDLVLSILAKLSSSASSPSDFISVLLTCKRFNGLGLHSFVLSRASPKAFAVKADKWSESAHRFLKLCADAGNAEACFTLGMIRFYCLENRGSGASLMAKAAIKSHAPALYSLAVIQFNGSGGSKNDKDLRAGVALCARAAFLGHIDALRELGHCLQDGYGVRQNVAEGRRYLVQANARELAAVLSPTAASMLSSPAAAAVLSTRSMLSWNPHNGGNNNNLDHATRAGCPLLSDFGCNVPAPEAHPANRFLSEWFTGRGGVPGPGLRLCSHAGCGRSETRKHEFRRCSVCGTVNYCSRACQALDWKLRHKVECAPVEQLIDDEGGDGGENDGVEEENDDVMVVES